LPRKGWDTFQKKKKKKELKNPRFRMEKFVLIVVVHTRSSTVTWHTVISSILSPWAVTPSATHLLLARQLHHLTCCCCLWSLNPEARHIIHCSSSPVHFLIHTSRGYHYFFHHLWCAFPFHYTLIRQSHFDHRTISAMAAITVAPSLSRLIYVSQHCRSLTEEYIRCR